MNNLYISITAGIRIGVRCVGSIVCPIKNPFFSLKKKKKKTRVPANVICGGQKKKRWKLCYPHNKFLKMECKVNIKYPFYNKR